MGNFYLKSAKQQKEVSEKQSPVLVTFVTAVFLNRFEELLE